MVYSGRAAYNQAYRLGSPGTSPAHAAQQFLTKRQRRAQRLRAYRVRWNPGGACGVVDGKGWCVLIGRLNFVFALLAAIGLMAGCSDNSKNSAPTATAEATATPAPAKPQLNKCPVGVDQGVCDYAAAAEGWVQRADIQSLIGGGPFDTAATRADLESLVERQLPATPEQPRKLKTIACPVVRKEDAPRPDCSSRFALVLATVNERDPLIDGKGLLVMGYNITAAGPQLYGYGIPEQTWQLALLAGPMTGGEELPGTNGSGLGFRIYPVEVLPPGATPATPTPGGEQVGGVEVRALTIGSPASLPDDLVVYIAPSPWAADSFPVLLWRVYRGANGEIRRDDLFANAQAQVGPVAIVAWAGDERMGEIVFVACGEGKCRGTGVGGWAGEFDAYRSTDGGMTWARFGAVPAMAFPMAVTPEGTIFGHFLGRDAGERPLYRFFELPSGETVTAPAANTEPRIVPGFGLTWEPTYRERGFGVEPVYDDAGKVIPNVQPGERFEARLIGALGGATYGRWEYVPDRPADPHERLQYLGWLDASGKPIALFTPGDSARIATWNGPYLAGSGLLVANAEMVVSTRELFDVPVVLIDLARGVAQPLRELDAGLTAMQQPVVKATVLGRVARVHTVAGCLEVRGSPSVSAPVEACYQVGVLLSERGAAVIAEGESWLPVTTPDRREGWAPLSGLERR